MLRRWRAVVPAAVLVLAACAPEVPEFDPTLPLPPPPPPRLQGQRLSPPPARPGTEAAGPATDAAPPVEAAAVDAPAAAIPAAATPVAAAVPAPIWRVGRDGTIGCANAASLRLLRQGAETTPRQLAEARTAGGCRTTFRVNEWALEAQESDIVRLRLTNGPAMVLWFARTDVTAP